MMKKTKFKFHKIGNNVASGWYCLIDSIEVLTVHIEHMGRRVAQNWILIKDSPEDKDGHCGTQEAGMYKTLLRLEMAKNNVDKMSMMDSLDFMTKLSLSSLMNIFQENGEVYVAQNGSCRPSTRLLDCEEILEKVISENYVYPTRSKDEFDIKQWVGGRHYYVMENGKSIEIDGKIKWNTCNAAEEALKTHFRSMEYQSQ